MDFNKIKEAAKQYGIPLLARIPVKPEISEAVDNGTIEYVEAPWMDEAAGAVEAI